MARSFVQLKLSLVMVMAISVTTSSSQECRSYQRQTGKCVSIKHCPPLLFILTNNPTPAQLRGLQRLTCGFDSTDPKICCPQPSIVEPSGESGPSTPTAASASSAPINAEDLELHPKIRNLTEKPLLEQPEVEDYSSHPAFKQIPSISECGKSAIGERVIGGINASHGSYPWIARIGYKGINPGEIDFHCGGTVISKRFILTAAHCSEAVEKNHIPISIRLGEHDTLTEEDCNYDLQECSKVEDYKIEAIIAHPEYNLNTKQNDITLIRVDRDINFDSVFIKPICLPFMKEYNLGFPNTAGEGKGIVAGFGKTKWNNVAGSTILQFVSLPIKSNEECQAIYNRRVKITESQICAGGEQGQDSCGGDSGGPLMIAYTINKHLHYRMFQLGVVSFGPTHCGVGGLPGVYARTQKYLKWILDMMNKYPSSTASQ